ncbi:hypothetical protein CEXT_158241 [Caerostris extrusa]|uniref:Uncharacterized protein n=1 Tax=Caerostris extrusa TaxID=172846 RepID=A0AAV4XF90_CAEEX|nr:hypothetical protein CEXT_158241 [Caerostris extrusa]
METKARHQILVPTNSSHLVLYFIFPFFHLDRVLLQKQQIYNYLGLCPLEKKITYLGYVMHSDPFDPFFQPLFIFFRENFTGVLVSRYPPGYVKDVYPLLPGSGTNVKAAEQFPLKPYIPRPIPFQSIPFHNLFCSRTTAEEGGDGRDSHFL